MGVITACRDDGLCYVMDIGFYSLSANLAASTVLSLPIMCIKTEEEVMLVGGGSSLQVRVLSRVQE